MRRTPALRLFPKGEFAIIEISDTGLGMAPSDLDRIFEPFFTKKQLGRSGTGLGMSVVWGTVKDHAGFFDITTEEGTGTTFVLYFPKSRGELEMPLSIHIQDYLGKGESILVIDDDPQQRDLAKRMMQRLGYEVHTAESGESGLALISKRPYDLLILDMIMAPGMDGLDTYREVLKIVPDQKAVIASGYAETHRVRETQRLGAGRYIKKPFTLEKIGLAVRAELDQENRTNFIDSITPRENFISFFYPAKCALTDGKRWVHDPFLK
jgi:two-component system cell cycle sensor histidine kinase/response regulator CckA